MKRLGLVYLGGMAALGAAVTLACSSDGSSDSFQQDTENNGSNDGSASGGSGDGAAASSDGTPSGTSGAVESTTSSSGSSTTTGGGTSGSGNGSGASGDSGGSGSGGAGSGGFSTSDGTATTGGGSGGTGSTAAGGTAGSSTDGGSTCEVTTCLRPYECVEYCGGPILSSDCCPCAAGLIDSFIECPNACAEGDTMDDGCNTCLCSGGTWVCTTRACPDVTFCGAMAGDTCGPDEYCAYVEGEYCGAADAQSTCQPRPEACITLYDPVCGCDGKTYGNSCEAAAAGTGVNTSGPCEASP